MTWPLWIAFALSVLAGVYAGYDFVKKLRESRKNKIKIELSGDQFIVDSALKLLKPYEDRVAGLISDLKAAEDTAKETKRQLEIANGQILVLNGELAEARSQISLLQLQVKGISHDLDGGEVSG